MLFNWMKQGKTCIFSRKSSFSSYVHHKTWKTNNSAYFALVKCSEADGRKRGMRLVHTVVLILLNLFANRWKYPQSAWRTRIYCGRRNSGTVLSADVSPPVLATSFILWVCLWIRMNTCVGVSVSYICLWVHLNVPLWCACWFISGCSYVDVDVPLGVPLLVCLCGCVWEFHSRCASVGVPLWVHLCRYGCVWVCHCRCASMGFPV